MLSEGDRIPDATVWTGPRDSIAIRELAAERPALFVFYLYDWSST